MHVQMAVFTFTLEGDSLKVPCMFFISLFTSSVLIASQKSIEIATLSYFANGCDVAL